jgi:hypothetical protein
MRARLGPVASPTSIAYARPSIPYGDRIILLWIYCKSLNGLTDVWGNSSLLSSSSVQPFSSSSFFRSGPLLPIVRTLFI